MSVTYPRGFRASGVTAGFKPSGAPDLGLLMASAGTTAAGLFTTNRVQAAPVRLSRARLGTSAGVRAVIVNSGQANAGTGERGDADALATTSAVAELLELAEGAVLPCSTGVIGEPLHVDAFLDALPAAVGALSEVGGEDFARAIMTTDTVLKAATAHAGASRVGGAAKGVGMIAPSLATMLAFVTTDATVAPDDLRALTRTELEPAFESISVDACPSTNDTVLLLASGAATGVPTTPDSAEWNLLAQAVGEVGQSLARQLIADGEGVSHVLLVEVSGATDDDAARRVARAIADSPLVKTAAYGADPNPGRILQAAGAAGVALDPAVIDVAIGGVRLVRGGVILPGSLGGGGVGDAAAAAMRGPEVRSEISIGDGPGRSLMLGGDLSHDYVRINGEYTT